MMWREEKSSCTTQKIEIRPYNHFKNHGELQDKVKLHN